MWRHAQAVEDCVGVGFCRCTAGVLGVFCARSRLLFDHRSINTTWYTCVSFYVLIMDKFIQLKNIQVTQSGGEVYSASFKPGYYISLAVFDVPMSKYKRQKRVLVETSHDDRDKEKKYYELFFTNDKTGFA